MGDLPPPLSLYYTPAQVLDLVDAAVKQERESLSLPKSYGGSTFSTLADQGCTVRLHFTDAKEAEEWVNRLTDRWDATLEPK